MLESGHDRRQQQLEDLGGCRRHPPAGTGHSVTLAASTADASFTCGGSATFNVVADQTTQVTVAVTCKERARTGSVLVNGALLSGSV